jgi:kynureninase
VKDLNVDFATGGSVKWLCGGPGAGYLYVRPDLIDQLEPKTTGWMAHEHPFAFETEMHYAPNVTRFLHGSPAIPALYAAESGYRIINSIGVNAIREKSVRQTQHNCNCRGCRLSGDQSKIKSTRRHLTVWDRNAAALAKTRSPRIYRRLSPGRGRSHLSAFLQRRELG